ncbi:hypothetical protein U9M48_022975 [Paspalum notatum var. saurae]|uniref:HMA domain-containing protein n=1 Tax=Paspalum notatum var. saurae TaxID=547442 RepID=A0AAQ3TJL9_PASNO
MRKEIIIRIHVNSDKCQAKAMKVAAAVKGVESVTLAGGDKSLLLVIGDGVDSNNLVKKLKKKVAEAEIVELRTHDTFESTAAAALPLPATKQELAMAMAAARSPYNSYHHQQQQYSYAGAPTSPYPYQYYPSPAGGYGYGNGYGYGGSSYSRAVARSHPANYSPLVERHDHLPMNHSFSSSKRKQTMAAVPRRGGTSGCTIL